MVKNIKLVIGANFGDEGKGLMTDYFCHQAQARGESCIVVLHNGGAQRGHTVVTPEELGGIRHVFHHFGSGTFAGADTYLSKDFIINPMIFRQEWEELEKLGYKPKVYADDFCMVSTPYDMILNQLIEESRSENRHGSCGVGIYETIRRSNAYNHTPLDFKGFVLYDGLLREKMVSLRDKYFKNRIDKLGITLSEEWKEIFYSDKLIDHYIDDVSFMCDRLHFLGLHILSNIGKYQNIIFEGGQGLLLDQNNTEYFPHLTPSNTGSLNPSKIIKELQLNNLLDLDYDPEACYVTRTYLTRHGAGRLENECPKEEINPDMVDLTNVPNPHQGTLRYGRIDEVKLMERIKNDFKNLNGLNAKMSLAVTHVNEYRNTALDNMFNYNDDFPIIYNCCTEAENGVWCRKIRSAKQIVGSWIIGDNV